jgi:branched-chain amino acid transport system permease protein
VAIWVDLLNRALLFSSLAVSLNLLMGYLGYLSLAHAAFFGVGAYVYAILTLKHDWAFAPALLVAAIGAAVGGLLVALAALRMSLEYVVLMTLAFLTITNQLAKSWLDVTGGATGLFPIRTPSIFGYTPGSLIAWSAVFAILLLLTLAVVWRLGESPFGRVLKAVRDDPRATGALGKNVVVFQFAVFATSAALAGIAGSLWGSYLQIVTPTSFGLDTAILLAAMVVLGGVANPVGSVVAASALVVLPQVLNHFHIGDENAAPIRNVLYGVILVLLVRYRPAGLLRESRHVGKLFGLALSPAGDAEAITREQRGSAESNAVLRGSGLRRHFGSIKALDGVDIELDEGEITALIGPNGAGKSTLFNVLTGDTRPDAGSVNLRGEDITGLRPYITARRGLGRTFQDVRLFPSMSVRDNVAVAAPDQAGESMWRLFLTPGKVRRDEAAARRTAVSCVRLVGLEHSLDEPVSSLAFGDQKLVALARLLAMGSDVMLLDEPSSGTDPQRVQQMLDIIDSIAKAGHAVCVVEHNLDVIRRLQGRAYFLEDGKILAVGTVDTLMDSPELVKSYFGVASHAND